MSMKGHMSEADVNDLFAPEELHPELAACTSDFEAMPGFKIIRHKLVVSVPHSDVQNRHMNLMLAHKKKALESAIADKQWARYVFLHERAFRLEAFLEVIHDHLGSDRDPETIWNLVADIWTDSENIHEFQEEWETIWSLDVPDRAKFVMDEENRTILDALPDPIPVYRGVNDEDFVSGLSWTVDRKKAEWFAKRYSEIRGDQPVVAIGRISKWNVLAYFRGRGESEIVAMPDHVKIDDTYYP